jgi:hypothetical protein
MTTEEYTSLVMMMSEKRKSESTKSSQVFQLPFCAPYHGINGHYYYYYRTVSLADTELNTFLKL